ncbi:MAG: hypothetical protein ACLUCE_09950 [Streptococcus sp.]
MQSIGAAIIFTFGDGYCAYGTADSVEERAPIVATVALTQGLAREH